MNYLEQSLAYEAKYGAVSNRIHDLITKRRKAADEARRNGKEFCDVYTPLIMAYRKRKAEYRKQADEAFAKYKGEHTEIDEDAVNDLLNEMIIRAALDYEMALSKGNDRVVYEIEQFAESAPKVKYIFDRIRSAQRDFKKVTRSNIISIIKTTDEFRDERKGSKEYSDKKNPNRCPLCGAGLYIKQRKNGGVFIVGCSGCSLTEVVKLPT